MAGSSLLALLDDIASLLDDVAAMSKLAAKKTAGVLGDDLALNAQQVVGIRAERELPVVWAVCLGSLKNKAILVPAALAISALVPWLILPLLMVGGAYLCFEGFEKLAHSLLHKPDAEVAEHDERLHAVADPAVDMASFERDRIRGAIRTDFVLSAEIIVITLGMVAQASLMQQVVVLVLIAVLMTFGVYGFVAAIVKMDDAGLYLATREGAGSGQDALRALGRLLLNAAPWLMKALSVVGTAAMFLVGGGILGHGLPPVHDFSHHLTEAAATWGSLGGVLSVVLPVLLDLVLGLLAGALVLLLVTLIGKLKSRP